MKNQGQRLKCTEDLDSNPSVVSRDVVEETATGGWPVGRKEAQCWFKLNKNIFEEQSISGPVAKRHS